MSRFKLTIEYDGTRYAGWQMQKGGKTIQGEILHAKVNDFGDMLVFHVVGSHFLWKQVRRMTGVLVEVGRGKLSPADVASFFRLKSDIPAKLTAPPSGLFLEKVYYKKEEISYQTKPIINI